MLRTRKLIVGSLLATAMFMVASDLVLAGKPAPPPPPLPNVRYGITYVPLPDNADPGWFPTPGGITNAFPLGNKWQVQVVGMYRHLDGRNIAFLYDPTRNVNACIDLNGCFFTDDGVPLDPESLPDTFPAGHHLSAARDINDYQVVIGHLEDESGNRRGFAIDLTIDPPVLDLLPTNASMNSSVRQINENGDILIAYQDASGTWGSFLFNPGYYCAPDLRAQRDGTPLDFSNETESLQMLDLSGEPRDFRLNNPCEGREAQIGGRDIQQISFSLYNRSCGTTNFQLSRHWCIGLSDDGAFCGEAIIKNKGVPFRYYDLHNPPFETLSGTLKNHTYPHDMNFQHDLLTRLQIYRDDWGIWIAVKDLLVGSPDDLALWEIGWLMWPYMSDRVPVTDSSGSVIAEAGIIAGGHSNIDNVLIVLTPEAWPQ